MPVYTKIREALRTGLKIGRTTVADILAETGIEPADAGDEFPYTTGADRIMGQNGVRPVRTSKSIGTRPGVSTRKPPCDLRPVPQSAPASPGAKKVPPGGVDWPESFLPQQAMVPSVLTPHVN